MNEPSILDRLRARALGELTRAEREELERALAADPALRALAEDFALVHVLTAVEPGAASSHTRFEELEARIPRARHGRRVAAAAALLLATGAAFWLGRRSAGTDARPLYLRSIELDAPLVLASLAGDVLAGDRMARWSDYEPRGANGVRFLDDLGEAEELARAAGRPLLVYGYYPGCPLAAALDAKVFSDPRVAELAERAVPVRVNLATVPDAEERSYLARGYPFLEMWRVDGRTTHSLARNPDPITFVESLHDGLARSDATGEQVSWKEMQEAARALVEARTAELDGRLASAERGYHAVTRDAAAPLAMVQCAAIGLARLAEAARVLLLEARAADEGDPAASRRLLERAVERFAGTSFELDLRAALERLERDGRFPALAEADHSA